MVFLLLLSACDSAEERAEKHFQSAIEFIEAGDDERAIIELKNVLKLNAQHYGARTQMAEITRRSGNAIAAAKVYARLVEQFPDDFEGQIAAAELYAELGNYGAMEGFVVAAMALRPEDSRAKAVQLVFQYQKAVTSDDAVAALALAASAQALISKIPTHLLLRQLMVDSHVRRQDYSAALAEVDVALKQMPDELALHQTRLAILAASQDGFGYEQQLKDMIVRSPADDSLRAELVNLYILENRSSEAELLLRSAAFSDPATSEAKFELIRFISETQGTKKALVELDQIIVTNNPGILLQGLRAGFIFDLGEQQEAIGIMRDLLETADQSDATQKVKIALSQMLATTDDIAGAQSLLDQVLVEDPANIEGLKRKAALLINENQTADAILLLRTALAQVPDDTDVLASLVLAYERQGKLELAGEMLLLAANSPKAEAKEAIAYANFLRDQAKPILAEPILIEALRKFPDNIDVLTQLGALYVETQDWVRAEHVQLTMVNAGSKTAKAAANNLRLRILQGQQNTEEVLDFLTELAAEGAGISVDIAVVQSHLENGNQVAATNYVAKLIATDPNNPEVRFLDASVDVATGDLEAAEQKFLTIVEQDKMQTQAWVALFRIYSLLEKPDAAIAIIKKGRQAAPKDPTLMWIDAGQLETAGELENAISIYETMYSNDRDNLLVANNLASLLSTARTDEDSLKRAFDISRRFKSSNVAPFQDTYGWISYLNGDYDEALQALEFAANDMVKDPAVQFHLAQAYLAVENPASALKYFRKVLELVGAGDERSFIQISHQEIERLSAGSAIIESD